MSSKSVRKYLHAVFCNIMFLLSVYTLFYSVKLHLQYIDFPYQHEYREGAVLPVTKLYTTDLNPYDIQYQPQNTYSYGFLYPRIVSWFAKEYGNTLAVHRSISYIFILLTCILIFITLLRLKVNLFFAFTAAVILHQSLIYNGLIALARPEALGIFLYISGIILPWRYKFSLLSCIAGIILGILGYITKPYFVLVIPFTFIYLFFFISKRKALVYGIVSFFLISIMAITVDLIYDTYLNNTIFHNINSASYIFSYMVKQLLFYIKINIFLFLIIFCSSLYIIVNLIYPSFGIKAAFKKIRNKFSLIKSMNVFRDEPVWKTKVDLLFSFVLFSSILLFIFQLGGHIGSDNAEYLFHLASPFLILATFQFINNTGKIFQTATAILLIITLRMQFKPVSIDLTQLMSKYKKTEDVISKSRNVLNSSETVSIILGQNKPVYNSGHTEYFQSGISGLSLLLGVSEGVENRFNDYKKDINEKIRRREFDLILISTHVKSYDGIYIEQTNLIQNYQCNDTLKGPLSKIEAWIPR